jgi:hypothetical protein
VDNPTLPALSRATVTAEDRLYDAIQPVLEVWMDIRDNLVEELERREGMTLFPPGGCQRAEAALCRLDAAEKEAHGAVNDLLVSLSRSDDPEPAA